MEDVQAVVLNEIGAPRSRLRRILSGEIGGSPLVDIGATSLTGIRVGGYPGFRQDYMLGNPICRTLALSPDDCQRLGSDFIRTGLLFEQPEIADEQYIEEFGVHWIWQDSAYSPLYHPLETAEPAEIARHPVPQWKQPIQEISPEAASAGIVIADAPCPGLLGMCFMLRSSWQFIEDFASDHRMVSALLEWSLEAITQAYARMLKMLPRQPDVIVYGDDLGFESSMFFSPSDFRNYLLPSMRTLISRLRSLTSAAICFHSCGAILPILPDIADLGIEIVNLDTSARGMAAPQIRQKLPRSVVMHGPNDLCALGAAVASWDKARIAFLITELAESSPVIAGPMDSIASIGEVRNAALGAFFIRNLSDDDFIRLRQLGPVRSIIETALEETLVGFVDV